ncbi:MAG: sigma-70 family RNA polymerase sigma factor [Planctomycetia bacterium]|nr:sigma-70 family RNA polymerase sigma factor [Planctomycetia bacterium]
MAAKPTADATAITNAAGAGDAPAAQRLMPLLYEEFRRLARRYLASERAGHTLQPTSLVHEAYLKLIDQTRVNWQGRTHFLAVGAQAMRRILADHARGKNRVKRGGGRHRIAIDEQLLVSPKSDADVLVVDEALERLAQLDPRQAKMVELRFFGGLSVEEVAEVLGVSKRTVESEWKIVRAWLRRALSEEPA